MPGFLMFSPSQGSHSSCVLDLPPTGCQLLPVQRAWADWQPTPSQARNSNETEESGVGNVLYLNHAILYT